MIPIGCHEIDELLGGGLQNKVITQIYGPAGSGKTNICIHALINAVRAGKKVVFIDTEGGFSEKRLKQMAGKDHKQILENTVLAEVTNFDDQKQKISDVVNGNFDLIIIDSITALYRLEKEEDTIQETNRELGRQLAALLEYARKREIPVLVTNQVYSDFGTGKLEPVGGDVLRYSSKVILELENNGDGTRKAILKKHLSKKENESACFKIVESGLVDVE